MGNIGFFECECMPFRLHNALAMFQRLMQNCLGKLNMTYCLICLDDIIVFSKTEEEHLLTCALCPIASDSTIWSSSQQSEFFKSQINCLAHHVSNESIRPSKENLKTVAEFMLPWTYTEIQAILGLVGHYRQFIKGFACIVQPLQEHLSCKGPSRKNKQVTLTENALSALKALKKVCLKAPVLAFVHFNKPLLLETEASKQELGPVLSQKQMMDDTIQ